MKAKINIGDTVKNTDNWKGKVLQIDNNNAEVKFAEQTTWESIESLEKVHDPRKRWE